VSEEEAGYLSVLAFVKFNLSTLHAIHKATSVKVMFTSQDVRSSLVLLL